MHRMFAFLLAALSTSPAVLWADPPHEPTYLVKEGDTLSARQVTKSRSNRYAL
jgi:hypothetical protein